MKSLSSAKTMNILLMVSKSLSCIFIHTRSAWNGKKDSSPYLRHAKQLFIVQVRTFNRSSWIRKLSKMKASLLLHTGRVSQRTFNNTGLVWRTQALSTEDPPLLLLLPNKAQVPEQQDGLTAGCPGIGKHRNISKLWEQFQSKLCWRTFRAIGLSWIIFFFCKQLRLCTRFPWEGLTDRVGDLTGTPQGHGVAHSLGLSRAVGWPRAIEAASAA